MKKSQVSLFVIAGIVILIATGLLVYMREDLIGEWPPVPREIAPINTFTKSCIKQITEQGVFALSTQGGYIEIPERYITQEAYMEIGFRVPYWFYNGEERIPSTAMMERQLSAFINNNLPDCLGNYRSFKAFTIKQAENITTTVNIGRKHVSVKIDMPLEITPLGKEETISLEEFYVKLPVNLGEMHELAKKIMRFENEAAFLEDLTDEMIACSDWLPYEGMWLDCKPEQWKIDEMKPYLQQMIARNFMFLTFENTKYEKTDIPYYDKIYRIFFTKKKYPRLAVKTFYNPSWDMSLQVLPSKNGIVEPINLFMTKYLFQCIKLYHHKYSVEYPVVFQIVDEENSDYPFYFATPVIMRRNLPNRHGNIKPWPVEIDHLRSKQYCAEEMDVTVYDTDENGFIVTRPGKIKSRKNTLNVFAIDKLTQEPLAGVNISYQCVKFLCNIGTTGYPKTEEGIPIFGAMYMLKAKFPDCEGGTVIGEKPGYLMAKQQQSVKDETDNTQVTLDMIMEKPFNFRVDVVVEHQGVISKRPVNKEEAYITIKNEEYDFEKSLYYPSSAEFYTNLTLLMAEDITYSVDVKLISNDRWVGGSEINWTPSIGDVVTGNQVVFYAVKKDLAYPPQDEKDYQKMIEYSKKYDEKYPPVIIQ